jgi:enamine deaminase RidA (YjgF/YER057c/UK114 family)
VPYSRYATTERLENAMTVELISPDGLPKPEMYAQVGIATGTRTVYVAGQAARDADGKPVGTGDLAAQVEQAFVNVDTAVRAAGGTFDDVAKLTIYVVDWTPDKMGPFGAGAMRAATRLRINPVKPGTLIGVAALAEPDLLVEIEAIAVLP